MISMVMRFKGFNLRISHMADYTLEEVKELIENINDILGLK